MTRHAVSHRTTCRLCGAHEVELVVPLAATPPADAYVSADRVGRAQERYPLDLYLCRSCGHAQLLDVVDPEILFGDYIYLTASSPGLVEHFRRYAGSVLSRAGALDGRLAVDIGSNDGTLLRFFKQRGLRVLGVDPATSIARQATESGIDTIGAFFTSALGAQIRTDWGEAAIVTANNVFAHADDLGDIADGIVTMLAPDGIFVFEVSYLVDLVQGMVFDYIYHEHLCYHSVGPLHAFLRSHGLELIDAQRIATKGGSLRCIAQPAGGPRAVSSNVADLLALEAELQLRRSETFKTFASAIDRAKTQLGHLLDELRRQGKTLAGYGASATVTTLLYHFDLGQTLSFIVDDNPSRQGLFTPGLHIPVVSPQMLYERQPEYVVVLAWRFADAIVTQHRTYLERGGHFVVPLPELRLL